MAERNSTLQSLLSTKAALDLGLVSQDDYDVVKAAFLRAQQIRAAKDAGLVKDEDYESTKQQYLSGLGSETLAAPPPRPPASNGSATRVQSHPVEVEAAPPRLPPQPHPAAAPRPAPPQQAKPAAMAAAVAKPAAAPAPAPAPAPAAVFPRSSSRPDIPANIPNIGGAKGAPSGVSMSGISLSADAVNLYYLIRAKSTYRWALWGIDDAGTTVIIAGVGEPASTYEDFLAALPENDCRYGVYDYQYTAPDGQVMNKLVFLNWAPDTARVKAKMMYASTKDFFKGHLDGISAEFQASDLGDVGEEEVGEAVRALKRG